MAIGKIKPNIYQRMANRIEKSPRIQNILKKADANPAIFSACSVAILASVLRPSAMMITPSGSKDGKKDKVYSSAKSIASGVVDLGTALMVFMPLQKVLDKSAQKLYNTVGSTYYQNKDACSNFKSLSNRGVKFITIPFVAWLNFRYVKTIADKVLKRGDSRDR